MLSSVPACFPSGRPNVLCSPGLCSQICLPPGLWGVAQKHGVTNGTCAGAGFTVFQYATSQAGVQYNVYAAPSSLGASQGTMAWLSEVQDATTHRSRPITVLEADHSTTPYVCPADKLQTAMKLDGDG